MSFAEAIAALPLTVAIHYCQRREHAPTRSDSGYTPLSFRQSRRERLRWKVLLLRPAGSQVRAFARTYNREWLIERLGYRSPLEGSAPGCPLA